MNIYFSGIGGVGIGPLAMLALDAGYTVSGSDLKEGDMTKLLAQKGARVKIGQDGSQIEEENKRQPIEWLVHSSALPDDHPELQFARDNSIKTTKRDEFINLILKEKNLSMLAVAGTHGKTTTTGMLIWLFKSLNIPFSYSVGTTLSFGPPAQYQPESEYFVYECDEFDRNFLHFSPKISAVTTVDYDHVETYPTQVDYDYAFTDFISQSAYTLLWQQTANHLSLHDTSSVEVLSESDPGLIAITLKGDHTRQNAWLAIQTLHQLMPKYGVEQLTEIINKFPGTDRRFEKLANNLYSDYAHLPTEISATIQAAQEVNKNVIVVYQPHQNVRQSEILRDGGYKTSFVGAKHVYWLPTFLSREYKDAPTIEPTELVESTTNKQSIEVCSMNDQLWQAIKSHISDGDLVLCMSAGSLDAWIRQKSNS